MADKERLEVTRILREMQSHTDDGKSAGDRLFPVIYGELRRLARGLMRGERSGHTLQSTALVHEAYLRLVDHAQIEWQSRAHFLGVAARAMRQILVDHARSRLAAKRGGGWRRITLDENLRLESPPDVEILEFERELAQLRGLHERMASVAELKVFGGMTMAEIAHVLDVSRQTVHEDWRVARMWLARALTEGNDP
ncbi:MAG: RNA polymerase subunit sigma-70 [Candidatus Eisenbacteria bacterium]|nr:RNA polymerase subunit sigma-70 [Candidatus Eisenbacteria bacterium]